MCWQVALQALAPGAAAAGTTAAAGAGMAAGAAAVGGGAVGAGMAVGGTALTTAATAQMATALSTASFITSTAGSLLSYAQQAQAASRMSKAAHKQWQAEQAQLGERARQEKLRFQIENDQLARNAAVGIAKTKTMGAAQGLAGPDDRVVDFAIKAEEYAGLDRAMMDMKMASLDEASGQSTLRFQTALDQARSATSTEAFLGLGMNIAGGFFDSYRMFGALPFEDPAKYSRRITGSA